MGNLVLPKHSSDVNDFFITLGIYYKQKYWLENQEFVLKLKEKIGDNQYPSSYNKKAQLPKYFGFIVAESLGGKSNKQRITALGKLLYEGFKKNDKKIINGVFMTSFENIRFGKNNYGSPSSDSLVEAPNVALKAIKNLGYVSYPELSYILYNMDKHSFTYDECIVKLKENRKGTITLDFKEADKYSDNKPIMFLVNLGVLEIDKSSKGRTKNIVLSNEFKEEFNYSIDSLRVKYTEKNVPESQELTTIANYLNYQIKYNNKEYNFEDFKEKLEKERTEFLSEFSIEELEKLSSDNEVLTKRLFGKKDDDSLVYNLAHKFYDFGSAKQSDTTPVAWASKVFVSHLKDIEKYIEDNDVLLSKENYEKLYIYINELNNNYLKRVWFKKYLHILYPDVFPSQHSDDNKKQVLNNFYLDIEKTELDRAWKLIQLEKISNIPSDYFWYIIGLIRKDKADYKELLSDKEKNVILSEELIELNYQTNIDSRYEHNRILFGAPGTGKSYTLKIEQDDLLKDSGEYERVTFHPDYSYAHFVGTYKPVSNENGEISYEFVPGPFMRTYVAAMKSANSDNPKPYLLIIEEINRANVSGVFGDIFQLLDRNAENISEYPIQTSEDMRKYLSKELGGDSTLYAEIKIPDNMFIWATMNSADQGVYPMDTAFKRRWNFTYLGINDNEEGILEKEVFLGRGEYKRKVKWNELRKAINIELLEECKVNEDKLLGPYFVAKNCLDSNEKFIEVFKNKIIMYLFDDAAKHRRSMIFSGCDTSNIYSEICKEFDDKGVFIFSEKVQEKFPNKIELNEDSENMRYEKTDRNFGIAEVAETNFKDED